MSILSTKYRNVVLGDKRLLAHNSITSYVDNGGLIFGRPVLRGVISEFGRDMKDRLVRRRTVVGCRVSRCSRQFLHRLTLNCAGRRVAGLQNVPFNIGDLRGQRGRLMRGLFPSNGGKVDIGTAQLIMHTYRLHVVSVSGLRTSRR